MRLHHSVAGPLLMLLGIFTIPARPAHAADALQFFKNYFVTGDYAVGGVGVQGTGKNGFATGQIEITGVPANADILGAFLYWATVEHTPGEGAVGAKFGPDVNSLNDISKVAKKLGSGTPPCWSSGGATGGGGGANLQAEYRADVLRFLSMNPGTGKRWVNRKHTVKLPDSGNGNSTPSSLGASLVIIYRTSASYGDTEQQLKSIVIYDGSYTMNHTTDSMTQTIQGFYQASNESPKAKLTHIVSSGQPNFTERLLFEGKVYATNPFVSAAGPSWDNPTFDVSDKMSGAPSVTTKVDHVGSTNFDCLSWGAVILSTTVQDSDNDGLLDLWETSKFTDVATGKEVDLPGMGANKDQKDLFVQVDYMTNGHSHLPSKAALDRVAAAYKSAPIDSGKGIQVHFGVGGNYQTSPPDPAIIPASFHVGGNPIDENTTCPKGPCAFSAAGTVGWKTGYRFIRDKYFPYAFMDIFHYALFAHTIGIPTAPGSGIPQSISGIADLLGSDVMITLGKWDNQVGSDFTQAATLFHELGHNLGLRHGPTAKSANCEPNFLSSMNYLYQTAGLLDGKGSPQIDYSRQELPNLTEGSLSDAAGFGVATLPFQARWYVPMGSSPLLRVLGTNVATHHCNGTPKLPTENMIRVESGTLVGKPVDWDQDGQSDSGFAQDLDFDGKSNEPAFTGFNDWTHIDLKQIGGRRNVIKLSLGILKQDLAAGDSGLGDSGLGDSGLGDSGLGDSGLGDSGLGANAGDSGLGDSGLGDSGLGIELDYETASDGSAPNSLTATAGKQSITLNWNASNVTTAVKYSIYRAINAISPTNLPTLIGTVVGAPPLTTFVDNDVKNNVTYSYVVVMTDSKATQSGPSNAVTIKK